MLIPPIQAHVVKQ